MVHSFPKGINPKIDITAQMELKLVYQDDTVQHLSHSLRGLLPAFKKNTETFTHIARMQKSILKQHINYELLLIKKMIHKITISVSTEPPVVLKLACFISNSLRH